MHYSEFLRIKHSLLVGKGVYDGYVDKDSKLHIDPMLLKNCPIPEFQDAYQRFISYFDRFFHLHPFVKTRDAKRDRAFKRMVEFYSFPELANTGLGYSEKRIGGSGISGKISLSLACATCDIIEYGIVDREIFALMHFLEDGVGADRISDMVIHILSDQFLLYTQRVCQELEIPTAAYVTRSGIQLSLPFYNGKPIYFIPEFFLTELKMAHDYTDIDYVASYNSTLRHRVCLAIQGNWKDIQEMSKSDFRKLVYDNKTAYRNLMEYVKVMKVRGYNFIADKNCEYDGLALKELLEENPLDLTFLIEDEKDRVYNVALVICNHFKFLIEECRMYRLMYDNGRYKRETEWQHLFFSVASSFLKGGNIDIDISPETDSGAGELDFKFSHGSKAKTVVELKLTDNPNLLHGYRKQLPQYIVTEKGDKGIFVVIEIDRVQKNQYDVIKAISKDPARLYEIVIASALPRPSASNPQ